MSYQSRFFGRDLGLPNSDDKCVFIGNYQTVGFAEYGVLVSLSPRRRISVRELKPLNRDVAREVAAKAKNEAIAMYQTPSLAFRSGLLKR